MGLKLNKTAMQYAVWGIFTKVAFGPAPYDIYTINPENYRATLQYGSIRQGAPLGHILLTSTAEFRALPTGQRLMIYSTSPGWPKGYYSCRKVTMQSHRWYNNPHIYNVFIIFGAFWGGGVCLVSRGLLTRHMGFLTGKKKPPLGPGGPNIGIIYDLFIHHGPKLNH